MMCSDVTLLVTAMTLLLLAPSLSQASGIDERRSTDSRRDHADARRDHADAGRDHADAPGPVCTLGMYNDTNAVWACRAVDALQNNWFPSPIAGLYSYLDWNGFDGFWQNGVVLETLANFAAYTRSRRYESVLLASWRSLEDLLHAYFPLPSCDDELWFALAFARIYEVTGQVRFLNTSQQLLNFTWHTCWDFTGTCSGGMFFGDGHRIKITITNAQTLLLAAKLYRLTSHDEHLHQALQVAAYLPNNQVLHADSHLVSDELDVTSCQPNARTNYSYNAGMTMAGLTELYKATNRTSVLQLAHAVARKHRAPVA